MGEARAYEDLVCWQLAHWLKLQIDELTRTRPAASHRELCLRLRRAASDALLHIAEGFRHDAEAPRDRELRLANGALRQVHDELQTAAAERCLPAADVLRLQRLCKSTATELRANERRGTRLGRVGQV